MRTITIAFVTILFLTLNVFSKSKDFNWGILGGINFSHLNGGHIEQIRQKDQLTSKFGFNAGLYFSYNVNTFSSINMELLYIEKGSFWLRPFYIPHFYGRFSWDGDYVEYRINYVELPIQYEYQVLNHKNGYQLMNVLIGPFFSYAYRASDEWIFEMAPSKDIPSDPLDRNINHFDAGLTFGLKFFLDKAERIFVKINYDYSLINIHKNGIKRAPADFVDKKNLKMRSLLFYLGANF